MTPKASDRPETRPELLTRISSIRIVFHFLISTRIKQGTQLTMNPIDNDYWVQPGDTYSRLPTRTFSKFIKPSPTFSDLPLSFLYLLLPSSTFLCLLLPSLPSLPSLPKSFKHIQTHSNTDKHVKQLFSMLVIRTLKNYPESTVSPASPWPAASRGRPGDGRRDCLHSALSLRNLHMSY